MENAGTAGNTARRGYIAIDIGASSGRVVLGHLAAGGVELEVLHRFPNAAVSRGGSLHWDIEFLHAQVLIGLGSGAARARRLGMDIASIGIDTWAVDYGLLRDGELLGPPFAYRDSRTERIIEAVHRKVSQAELYRINGLQFLPFNTIYQLACEPDLRGLRALLVPDLLVYLLTGAMRTEETNASTTGLLDAVTGTFSGQLAAALGLDPGLFGELIAPGQAYGPLLPGIVAGTGLPPGTPVVAVGSHDTASAVVAVPAEPGTGFAYISSGTWSLVGLELEAPEPGRRISPTSEASIPPSASCAMSGGCGCCKNPCANGNSGPGTCRICWKQPRPGMTMARASMPIHKSFWPPGPWPTASVPPPVAGVRTAFWSIWIRVRSRPQWCAASSNPWPGRTHARCAPPSS